MLFKFSPSIRHLSLSIPSNNFFVTTPIYYVNANPHIGHLYSSVIADALCRWHQIQNKGLNFKFSTGTDEHGLKIQEAASQNNSTPAEYCKKISSSYKNLAERFNISFTDFIRTSEDRHKRAVHKFWDTLDRKGYIYSDKYCGWYCTSDETFLSDSQLQEIVDLNGNKKLVSLESGHPVDWAEELNYMFPLHRFQNDLCYWVKKENSIVPSKFKKLVLDALEDGPLPALSISRPSNRVHWGINVPGDNQQTIYVWLDALINYLTVAGYADDDHTFKKFWPPKIQVIGKDILKFHAIYWPIFLIAANLEPPQTILCHSHWTVNSEKMSKSKKNVICPIQASEVYSEDGLRYFLLREGVAHSDGNYSDQKVFRILNSELADTLGNLLSRCTGKAINPQRYIPNIEQDIFNEIAAQDVTKRLLESLIELPGICKSHYDQYNFYKGIDKIVATLHQANLFFETYKPWELQKCNKIDELNIILHITFETLRITGILLQPIVPKLSKNLLDKLNIPLEHRYYDNTLTLSWKTDFKIRNLASDNSVLFRRMIANK